MTYEIRFPTYDETPAIVQFIASTWGPQHILARDAELLRWQLSWEFCPNERGSGLSALTVWNAGEIVGMQGLIHAPFRIGAERLTSVWLCNLMVAEHHRPCGVGARLMTGVHNLPVDVIATSGINPEILPLYRKMRYHVIDSLDRYIHVIDAARFNELAKCQSPKHKSARPMTVAAHNLRLQQDDDFDDFWPQFSDQSLSAGYVGIDRTREYMRWRYVQHPRFDYKIFTVRNSDGCIRGIIVYRIEKISGFDGSVMRVLEVDAIDRDLIPILLDETVRIGIYSGVIFADYYSSTDIIADSARQSSWTRSVDFSKAVPSYFQPLDYRPQQVSIAARALRAGFLPDDWNGRLNVLKSDGDQDRPNLAVE
ncbi:hypothetical protein [Fodinicurvata sp. EGI_FJ10296]|uniref:hypothetical protein n=1 Tax=Fodinicurvata sp. EGI_FJ10296 TaxID=3231908 RepID=UPI00345326A4